MFDHFCSLFSNIAQPGQYAYETFKKVPQVNVLIEAANMISGMRKGDMINKVGTMANVANMAGKAFGFDPMQMIMSKVPKIGGLAGIL